MANHRAFLRYLERRVGDRTLAEDILKDAFSKLVSEPEPALRRRGSSFRGSTEHFEMRPSISFVGAVPLTAHTRRSLANSRRAMRRLREHGWATARVGTTRRDCIRR